MRVVKNFLRFLVFSALFIVVVYIYNTQNFIKFSWGDTDIRVGGTTFTNCVGLKLQENTVFGKCFVSSSFAGQR